MRRFITEATLTRPVAAGLFLLFLLGALFFGGLSARSFWIAHRLSTQEIGPLKLRKSADMQLANAAAQALVQGLNRGRAQATIVWSLNGWRFLSVSLGMLLIDSGLAFYLQGRVKPAPDSGMDPFARDETDKQ